ncbi:MAG: CDP-diacylglycerol--glycerol-3-phosphate 3-phosphatidyltransferase [Candidatus Neomarinimicrobiota bacterium]|nr:CDP-diacylglycerol--glycerol-3-phosphate 3-phosphatidyltransferase [Candidatus Neomarinimicrobiota bacterium]
MTIPNILTVFRIFLTPFFVYCLFADFNNAYLFALIIFIVASITDAYDGYYARKYDVVTESGKFLDPLADKILVSSAFISFAVLGLIEFWMVGLIIFRDIFITLLRMLMKRNDRTLVTSNIAKSKTSAQLTLIIFTLSFLVFTNINETIFSAIFDLVLKYHLVYNLTFFVSLFTIFTGYKYVSDNYEVIKEIIYQ